MFKRFSAIFFITAMLANGGFATFASAQKVVVGKAVPASQQVSMTQIDHSAWDQLLQAFVNEQGQVNYRAWKASPQGQAMLDNYLNTLASASVSEQATRESQLAFWINAYNAVTIKGILREYPTTSIRNHTAKFGGYNIWKDLLLNVGSTQISLNDIEHKVLRKASEPRIHFAIVCASHSCPRLLNRAYTAQQLEQQLATNTKAFFANPENFQYNPSRREFKLSSIIDWFKDDFGPNQAALLKTIAPYLPNRAAYDAAIQNSVRVSYLDYDWSLNEQVGTRSATGVGQNNQSGSGRR